ncbi:MAG TPA: ATP-binding protein [Terriglobia bacterium]|nr:ATP-binding protein [Terriglobia bacterium]
MVLRATITQADEIAAMRQRVKEAAAHFGFNDLTQIKLATAASEVARSIVGSGVSGEIEAMIDRAEHGSRLVVELRAEGEPRLSQSAAGDFLAVRKLVEHFQISIGPRGAFSVAVGFGFAHEGHVTPAQLNAWRATGSAEPVDPRAACGVGEQVQRQNEEIMLAMESLAQREVELKRLNAELEDTNRGVVALYSELDEKAEQLRRASDLKSRFLSNMGHEFRTPLNSILALSGLLMDGADGELSVEQRRQVTYIRGSAESLTELVNDLLDLAKVEAGRATIRKSSFSVSELVGGLRGMLKPLLHSAKVALVFDEPNNLPPLYTDMGKVSQILRNFISNALKFTEEGEVRLSIRLAASHGRIDFAVSDTGIGIAEEHRAAVFDEFVQIESPLQTRHKGTGLGLPLSKRLAELLGGTVSLQSEVGKGSTFTLSIPLDIDRPDAAIGGDFALKPQETAHNLRLLIIDDEETFRYIIRQSALEAQCSVLEASDGFAGLDLMRRERPDVVFLDLQMPVMNGFSVLREMRADAALSGLPVIICTSTVLDPGDHQNLAGATQVLSKGSLTRDAVGKVLAQLSLEEHLKERRHDDRD